MGIKKNRGLGKGLEAIFMENSLQEDNQRTELKISEVEPNKAQARKDFDDEALAELAESISAHGVLQPILVRPIPTGGYQIVAGERRWRASRIAGKTTIPAVIKDINDKLCAQISLIENLQRENLNPVEEAYGFKELIDEYDITQKEIGNLVFKSRVYVTNVLRLLNLPQAVLNMLSNSEITSGHARALLALENPDNIINAAKLVKEKKLSVRETEALVKKLLNSKEKSVKTNKKETVKNNFYSEVELALRDVLGRKINIRNKTKNSGVIEIEFYNEEDLKNITAYFNKKY